MVWRMNYLNWTGFCEIILHKTKYHLSLVIRGFGIRKIFLERDPSE